MIFWENDPKRALEWAKEKQARSKPNDPNAVSDPAVVGAIIDPRYCFDLISSDELTMLKKTHSDFTKAYEKADVKLPKNKPLKESGDLLLLYRNDDCGWF